MPKKTAYFLEINTKFKRINGNDEIKAPGSLRTTEKLIPSEFGSNMFVVNMTVTIIQIGYNHSRCRNE